MKYRPIECVKCGGPLEAPSARGGRTSRFCCDGCKVSAESEMRRLNVLLRKFAEGAAVERLNRRGEVSPERLKAIADMQSRYDLLAGVPPKADQAKER